VAVQAPAGVMLSGVVAGAWHTCAHGSGGKVYCWGYNADGQLGDGTDTSRLTPVAVEAPEGVVLSGVVAGAWHTCAHGSGGKVYCWGYNGDGQLGDGMSTSRRTPVAVQAPAGVVLSGVVAGSYHTCADGSDGKVYCWGYNADGQLGDGTNASRQTPVAVQAPPGVTLSGISAGLGAHTCALSTAGPVYCWGGNGSGQLGDGRTADSNLPVIVAATR
jgi:alpha-tubulin suppressor-like RCC1 family protein